MAPLAGGRLAVVAEVTGGGGDPLLRHAVNLMLELFGTCELLGERALSTPPPPAARLNWEMHSAEGLPQVPSSLRPVVGPLPLKDRRVAEYRIARVGELLPDVMAVGRGGFRGYAMFGFADRGRLVLENLYRGNETLVTAATGATSRIWARASCSAMTSGSASRTAAAGSRACGRPSVPNRT